MARTRKRYLNGQSRGDGERPQRRGSYQKDYHRQVVIYFGSESAYQGWLEKQKGLDK